MNWILLATSGVEGLVQNFSQYLLELVGNPMYIGLFFLIFVIAIILGIGIGFDGMSVCMIPVMFIVSVWIEPLRLIFAIVIGVFIGIGILRLIGKR